MFFYYSRFARCTRQKKRFSSAKKTFEFERNFSHIQSFFTYFIIVISFVGNSVLIISLYSVEFIQFLQVTILHWIHSRFCFFVCVQSASYLMYSVAVFVNIFLDLIFHNFELYPYSYPYTIILTLQIYQSVVLKFVQLFPMSSLFPSGLWLKRLSDLGHL